MKLIFAIAWWIALGAILWAQPCFALPKKTDMQGIEAFIDNFFTERMEKLHVPGAAFTLVKDGKIVFSQGYGYADLEKKIPVIPDKTLFRVGSVSKLFTATAVMQLAQQGKLNLNDDINKYLKNIQIDSKFSRPITFAHLLTHTDGFDSGWGIGAFARTPAKMTPLKDYLAKRLPPRILPPGEIFLYSDVGMTLAGYSIESISATSFARYIDENILQPLEMNSSSFLQPLPPSLNSNLAVGYKYTKQGYKARPFAYGNSVPAGLFSTTATDMARFALAHLPFDRDESGQILNNATIQEMHRQQFTHHPLMPGSAYGFYERFQNQQRAIEHGGRMDGYTSLLFLLPEQNLGFFGACNVNNNILFPELVRQFLDRYYPDRNRLEPVALRCDTKSRISRIKGFYRYNRYSHSTIEKLAAVLGDAPEIELIDNEDGTISLSSSKQKWAEVEPWLFRSLDRDVYLTFRRNDRGKIDYMFIGDVALSALERLNWYESLTFQNKLILFCSIVFILNSVFGFAILLTGRVDRLPAIVSISISLLNSIFLFGMGRIVFTTDFWDFFYGLPLGALFLLALPPVGIGLTGILSILAIVDFSKIYLFISIISWLWIWFLNYWNLLVWKIR